MSDDKPKPQIPQPASVVVPELPTALPGKPRLPRDLRTLIVDRLARALAETWRKKRGDTR